MTLVTVSGYPGSGTTTVVGFLTGLLGLPPHNIGDTFRILAEEKGISLSDLHRLAKTDRSIDRKLDDRQVEVARRGDVILEGRLAGFLTHRAGLPGTRVWLEAPFPVRARRVAARETIEVAQASEEIRVRQEAERTRYLEFYGFDLDDHSIYDLVIDTEKTPAEAIAKRIAEQAGPSPA
jgi:predicted cytidylate kinase